MKLKLREKLVLLLLSGLMLPVMAQVSYRTDSSFENPVESEFHFARMAFGVNGRRISTYRGEPWLRDFPEAEYHLRQGITRLTRLDADGDYRQVGLLDDALFDYPFLYAVKVGYWNLGSEEVERLRDYLLRGGTLMVDDFHGPSEWVQFTRNLYQVFPDRPIIDIPNDHEIFHVHYDLDDREQIGGINAIRRGVRWEHPQGVPEYWRGIEDDDGRLMVIINFNMDLGDAWEHADDPVYPEPLTAMAYRIGINYIIYSMTR